VAYQPIQDYGLIGNMHTAALVGRDGSIDWLCMPHFDSPSVFARILDSRKGGHFRIAPLASDDVTCKQIYWPDTNVLISRFLLGDGVVEVIDYMPIAVGKGEPGFRQLIRRVEVVRGSLPVKIECFPAFNYARDAHKVELRECGAVFSSDSLTIELTTRCKVALKQDRGGVEAIVPLKQGERMTFVLRPLDPSHEGAAVLDEEVEQRLFEHTVAFWHRWLSKCTYTGRWREMVQRSALALKLLTFEPTGALVASPTCSLPETVGGPRNWDYRYSWVRDAAFSLYGLLRIGFTEEAAAFMKWLEERCHERKADGGLQIVYGLRGEQDIPERTLDHLDGYRGSKPVRVGNAAADQLQLDIYGELMDSVYLYNKYGAPISYDLWHELSGLLHWVCDNWKQPDEGIWETRGGQQHFVYSKLMCWVAVDRGLRLADKRSFPADRTRWLKCRDDIYLDILKNGWSARRKAFVQHYNSDELDASNLIMPLVFFMSPNDPRMLSTLDATLKDPAEGGLLTNGLVYRYNSEHFDDGLRGGEGTFNMCTFWLVEALTRAGRTDPARLDQALLLFEKMLGFANHLGLYAEQIGMHGEALGNFPQALTHLALISSAYNLDRTLGGSRSSEQ
jgi:GH15 family glucan-1,4-alpha-glucosidase